MKTRVALDARLTRQMSVGMKAYAQELAARLPRVAPDLQFEIFARGGNFGWDEQVRLPLAMRRAHADAAHFLSLYTPVLPPRPYAVTVHDLIHLRFPGYFKSKVGPYYRTVVRFACARAARVITDDERTVADLQRFLGIDPAKVRVIPLGADDAFFRPAVPFAAPRPYIMYAGNHRPHKDLATLFAAWAALPEDLELDLYVTGSSDAGERYARANGRIRMLGEVSTTELAGYYASAIALVHPALCEGFGLPMLEAMAAGCPVIACEDAVPGVLRSAALTFPPRGAEQARAHIAALAMDPARRAARIDAGRTLASAFTWDRCAERTAQVYREMAAERTKR